MVRAALILVVLLGDSSDEAFLLARVKTLAKRYDERARQQTVSARSVRLSVVRELAHLPFKGEARESAGRLLARIVAGDRAYRVRADAARAIGQVGTAPALRAMYRCLFGADGRSRRFELIHAVLPEALERVRKPDDLDWISREVLIPAAQRRSSAVLAEAGRLRERLVALTLEGVARSEARILGNETVALARSRRPGIRVAALRALAALDLGDAVLRDAAQDPDARVRAAAAGFRRLPPALAERLLRDESESVRRSAVLGLQARPAREAVPLLLPRLEHEQSEGMQLDVAETLHRLTGKEFGTDAQLWRAWWSANAQRFVQPGEPDPTGRNYFFQVGLRTRRTVFVIDVSSSMNRRDERGFTRQARAAQELSQTLSRLPPAARFALLAFAAEVRRYPGERGEFADRTHATEALRWFQSLKPAGATNTYGAVMTALEDPVRPDTVVLLSDGNPYRCAYKGKTYSEHEQILAEVRRVNPHRRVRLHAVALLSGASSGGEEEDTASASEFLRRLAAENRGDFREVR